MNMKNYFLALIVHDFKKFIKRFINRYRWSKRNSHNNIVLNNVLDINIVSCGNNSYGELNVVSFADKSKLFIGNYVSIAQDVVFILDAEHYTDCISTYPFKVKILKTMNSEAFGKGDIVVDDDVWIGYGSTIMSGVHIGQGSVVAAGAVVTKDVPPYAVVGGVPAKIIKYRFCEELRSELLDMDYSKLTKEMITKQEAALYSKLTDIKQLDWIPRK